MVVVVVPRLKITGRVVCADGSPVPGAQVCAYEVDWWWWWSSASVGCAVTDVTGSFEIDFVQCCGWWPWWWWSRRQWFLEPSLVDRVTTLLRSDPESPAPRREPETQPRYLPAPAWRAGPGHGCGLACTAAINPAELESLRTRLVEKLPPAPAEFERLRSGPGGPGGRGGTATLTSFSR